MDPTKYPKQVQYTTRHAKKGFMRLIGFVITPARDPKQCGRKDANGPDTSNSSYEQVTEQVRQYRSLQQEECVLAQGETICLFIRTSYQNLTPGHLRDLTRSSDKNFLWASQKNFQTSTNTEHLQRKSVYPDPTPAFNTYRMNLSVWTLFGEKCAW